MKTYLIALLAVAGCGGGSSRTFDLGGLDLSSAHPKSGDMSLTKSADMSLAKADDMSTSPDMSQVFATPYFPLQTGLQWMMRQTKFDSSVGSDCYNDGSTLTLTTAALNASSQYPIQYQPACFYSEVDYQISGAVVDQTALGGTYVAFDFPPAQNKTWVAGGASGVSYVWDMHYDTYTVAAGTFSDCWRSSSAGGLNFQILCNGVGAVVSAGSQFQDYRWELTSKNF